jgi:hypothetical protein
VVSIGALTFENTALTSITIPGSVKYIGRIAFGFCANLASINVAADNVDYCSEDGVLFNKGKTSMIRYPPGKQGASYTIPSSVNYIREGTFAYCRVLTSVMIPSSVTFLDTEAFKYCESLRSVTISGNITNIGIGVFSGCANLTSVVLRMGLKYIGHSMFMNCAKLMHVTIPESVTAIGSQAWAGCVGLKSICIQKPIPPKVLNNAFDCVELNNVCLYVPASSITAYRVAESWKEFKCVKNIVSVPKGEP